MALRLKTERLSTHDLFVEPSRAFRPTGPAACRDLNPYFANVDPEFWQSHEILLEKLNVRDDDLGVLDLPRVQDMLEAKDRLDDNDVKVAVEILRIASRFTGTGESLAGLKILGESRQFYTFQEIRSSGGPEDSGDFKFTHPDIPLSISNLLGIDSVRDRMLKEMLEMEEDEDDEFDQVEDAMSRIADTLDRYPIETTFREYLANADDTQGASKIRWLPDRREHAYESLMTPEMKVLQGPALLSYNDGVFSARDFDGFKNVGQGSKMQDKETIGQFGRGSQTMSNFTSSPMILSGDYLLILDPEQKILPFNRLKGRRKPGMKLKLSRVAKAIPNLLAPFAGHFGFKTNMAHYPGTIFRFPLLLPGSLWVVDYKGYAIASDPKPFLGFVTCSFKIYARDSEELQADGLDEWWVSIENAATGTDLPPESSRRVTKRTECGIAALVYRTYTQKSPGFNFPTTTTSRMFNTLPLPIFSDLPVHVHATFTLSGDRKSIVLDDHNLKSASSESNRHFLEQEIPKMYLQFLAGLVVHLQQDVFIFWPQHEPPERSFGLRIWTSFWQKLSLSLLELFPKAQSAAQVLSNTSAGLLDINYAILDNLKAHDSRMLKPLLLNLEVDLLSDVPKPVANQLERIETVRRITGSMLRDLFKSVQSQESLCLEIASNPGFSWAKSVELDGCYVLLMADQSIGRLNLVQDDDTEYESYYIASDERSNFSNKRPPVGVPSRLEDLWLARFWQCWNSRSDLKDTELDEICESEAKIYRATRNGSDVYITPSELDLLPSVVTPSITEHRDLCLSIPGMYMVDPILMPALLMTKEETLNESDSFFRFIKSLSALAKITSFHNFVRQEISRENLTKIQDLTFYHLSKAPALASEDSLGAILKSFPLWPNFSAFDSINMISANDALIAENPSLLVSWVKNRHLFLDNGFMARGQNAECLSSLGVRKLPPEEMIKDYLLHLPQSVAVNDWETYRSIMDAIGFAFQSSASILDGLASQSIVSDGNCALKKANHFYDHQVPIFAPAFRYETRTRFVHTGIRDCLPWLRRIGLRKSTDHLVSFENYIECIRVMALRVCQVDARIYTTYLAEDYSNIHLQRLANPFIRRVFRSRVAFNAESEYRRERMAAVAKQQPELCLNQIISQDYLPVCWSQVPFAINEPTSQALGKTAGKGKPDVSVVWLHLQYLKSVSLHLRDNVSQQLDQNRDFFQDLKTTYGYLQDHPQETKALFGTNEDAILLNLESWDFRKVSRADIQDSWYPITALVLASSCDSGPIKAVRQGLMDFEKLLPSLGCSSIHYPTITRSDQHTQESYSATSSLNMLRQAGDLADIAFTSQGRTIKAHKVVLSAVSNVKRAQFCRNLGLKQEDVITYRESILSEFLSYRTLSVLVDYAYQQPIDWDDMEVTDEDNEDQKAAKLDVLLNLCKGADMWEMLALKSQAEDRMLRAGKMFLNLENCLQLAKRSADANAETFQKLCKAFIEQNMAAVMRAHPQGLD
ncbi:zinc finger family protein [Drepanopeziza brunnea f. sp. 'multigermtubi' MB_m1]|uniref:Zinc finger family protein n=1 Tax=Marssonina brunnea f. sp. multigermtubi (strain MB_m1) TaxID=1072389 RepID=K1XF67_MARBU|nr:zinc finger family protein [Drepanopeziza brunnea f. sp. 'multigermtubi' MB_m1]EKD19518.1 zinc finger family protein [Drepanopeziza brunnea f. sp. 'multigermtubi' MB_m1]